MMPLVNEHTESLLHTVVRELPHSLLLTGEVGVGLGTIANYIARQQDTIPFTVLPVRNDKIDLETGNIPVDAIRDLYEQTRTKRGSKQIIIIDYAERMSQQAQNAFLKLLEEPGESVYFILATHAPDQLLPTVQSRMTHVEIRPVSVAQSEAFLNQLAVADKAKRAQLLFMAAGRPAELYRLATNDDYFSVRAAQVRDARELLQASTYDQLLIANRYKDNREHTLQLLMDAAKIVRRTMSVSPSTQHREKIEMLLSTYDRIAANGNIRLCLTQLVLQ